MTDDQEYGDLSCMGNTDFLTPHIDALANNGARFTNWYANSPVCSPSRASQAARNKSRFFRHFLQTYAISKHKFKE